MAQLLRTLLFVPADRRELVAKARELPADVITLDLEDAVAPAKKGTARQSAAEALRSLSQTGHVVHVRVNRVQSGLLRDDLEAVVQPDLRAVLLPQVRGPQDIRDLDVLLREFELDREISPGTIGLIPAIESAQGLLRCAEIVTASTRIVALAFGSEDFVANLNMVRSVDGRELDYARSHIVTVARAHRLPAVDGPWVILNDNAGLEADTQRARAFGFSGRYVIHPSQIEIVNRIFSPSAAEVEAARRAIQAYEDAIRRGQGAVNHDGRLIDAASVQRLQAIIDLAEAIESRS